MILPLDRVAAILADPSFGALGAPALRMLLVLLAHTGADGVSWPSLPRLASMSALDRRDAQRTLRQLVDLGLVVVESEARGRRSRRLRVAPRAVERGLVDLLSPPTEAGEAPAPESVEAGEDPTASEAGEAPAPESVEAGQIDRRGGSPARPNRRTEVPPYPPVGGGGGSASRSTSIGDPSLAPAGARLADCPGGRCPELAARDAVLAAMREARTVHPNPFLAARAIDQALSDGLQLHEIVELIQLAQAQGDAPALLLVHWLDDVGRWRGVLADADLAARERRARAAPSERELHESMPTQVGQCAPALRACP